MRPRRRPEDRRVPQPQDRINENIRVPQVRLVGEDGEQIGIKSTDEAREYAYSKGLDLVEVNPTLDIRNTTAELGIELALSALGMRIL